MQDQQPLNIPADQALQAQFNKVGQLMFHIDILSQQLRAFEQENKQLKAELESLKNLKPQDEIK